MDSSNVLSDDEAQALRESGDDRDGDDRNHAQAGHGDRVVEIHADHWERIAADRIPALESIGERLASLLKLRGRRLFRQNIEVAIRPARIERWGSYASKLAAPASLNVLDIPPLNLKGVVCLDAGFIYILVDLFFGGDGKGQRSAASAEFTPVETRLARRFVSDLVQDMREAWKPFVALDFNLGATEISPVFAAVAGASDAVCVTGFDLLIAGREFSFDIVLPATLIEPIRHLRDAGQSSRNQADPQRWRSRLKADMQDARVSLRAVLVQTEIPLRDLTVAQPGDIIPIDIPATLTLYADGTPLLEGTFGVFQGRNAVRITRPANRAEVGEKYGRDENAGQG